MAFYMGVIVYKVAFTRLSGERRGWDIWIERQRLSTV